MDYICPVCNKRFDRDIDVVVPHMETHIVDVIKKRHPKWVEEDGTCKKCYLYYKDQIHPWSAKAAPDGKRPSGRVSPAAWDKESPPAGLPAAWVEGVAKSVLWREYLYWKRRLGLPSAAKTIEAGCGYGKFSMVLGLAGEKVSLLDSNAQALAAASTAHQQIGLSPECVLGDIFEKSRELGGRFDVVASFGVLEHFSGEGRLSALRAMSGFLRPGGMLFFTVPNRLSPFYRIAFGLRRLSGSVPKDLYEMPYSRSELVLLASSSGIDVLTVEGVNTLSDDLGYWIWGNAVSVARRMAGIKGSAPRADDRAGLKRPDLSGSSITDARGRLDKLYSSDLLFVGVKK